MEDLGRVLITECLEDGTERQVWAEALISAFATPGPIPYFPGVAQPLPVAQMPGPPFGLILQMDMVPEYVAKTFHLVERDSGVGYKSELYTVFIEGEDLDTTLRRWLIVYSSHEYHAKRAHELEQQLHDLISGAIVLALPVVG